MKTCKVCKVQKATDCFYKDKGTKDGFRGKCKDCTDIQMKSYYTNNKEKVRKIHKEYRENNLEFCLNLNRTYREQNKDKVNEYFRKRKKTDLSFKISTTLRSRLWQLIDRNTKTGSAVKDLGCSVKDLITHLERQFKPGMSWDNYGVGKNKWSIDHIIPLSKFDLSIRDEFLIACNYKNLQPLWFEENSSKGNRMSYRKKVEEGLKKEEELGTMGTEELKNEGENNNGEV